LLPIRKTSASVIFLLTAIMMLENVMPVMIGTFSRSISLSASCTATSGLSWLSSLRTVTGTPPSLPPLRSITIISASYWSCPSAPCGPLSSAMKPIFSGVCAMEGTAAAASKAASAPAASNRPV
jgi:hypothetical protein